MTHILSLSLHATHLVIFTKIVIVQLIKSGIYKDLEKETQDLMTCEMKIWKVENEIYTRDLNLL